MNYIILDLEATCWNDKGVKRQNEIIEIGALKLNAQGETISEFSAFVKPTLNPELSDFCTELTTITQDDVDTAQDYPAVEEEFKQWINVNEPYFLCSWGQYDKNQFLKDCELHGRSTDWLDPHTSIKHQYTKIKGLKRHIGMKGALWMEGIELKGTHHRGIDDARNIAEIFRANFGSWNFE